MKRKDYILIVAMCVSSFFLGATIQYYTTEHKYDIIQAQKQELDIQYQIIEIYSNQIDSLENKLSSEMIHRDEFNKMVELLNKQKK